ncbi:hypothetical protein GTV15_00280 [Streptomyces sp. SID7803]|nr:hypothetical protein [Streptomyces sp. SID7803]
MKSAAGDADVLFAARVSTAGEQSLEEVAKDPERSKGSSTTSCGTGTAARSSTTR